jgi:dipeptidase E
VEILCISLNMSPIVNFLERVDAQKGPLGFVQTAGNSYSDPVFVREDRARLTRLGFPLIDIDFDKTDRKEAVDLLANVSALYVAGGNTFHLLQAVTRLSLRETLAKAVHDGLPYVGASAGAVLLAEDIGYVAGIDDPSVASSLADYRGLGLIKFRPLPHFGKPKYMSKYFAILESDPNAHYLLLPDNRAFETSDGIKYTVIPAEPVPTTD